MNASSQWSEWKIQQNEWNSLPGERKNKWIRFTLKTKKIKKKKAGMHLQKMMKDEWQLMKDERQITKDEW